MQLDNTLDFLLNKVSTHLRTNGTFKSNQSIDKVGVAVSGGADSTALLLLAREYCKKRNIELYCYTVDHKLRQESYNEAMYVKELCQELDVKFSLLEWQQHNNKKHKITQEDARNARYNLLYEQCRRDKVNCLLLAHHLDDQVETVIMRKRKNSHQYGLAGMSAIRPFKDDLYLLRPMLNIKKINIVKFLSTNNIKWFEDPSNENDKYLRSSIRKELASNKKLYLDILNIQQQASKQRINIEENYNDWVEKSNNIKKHNHGILSINSDTLLSLEDELATFILMKVITIYGGNKYSTRPLRLSKFSTLYKEIKNKDNHKTTIGNCIIQKNNKNILIYKEKTQGVISSEEFNANGWDNRFYGKLEKHETIGALGFDGSLKGYKKNSFINSHIVSTIPNNKGVKFIIDLKILPFTDIIQQQK